ncbi:MAG: ABC transporter permease [Actinomycetota bacterium]
MKKFLAQTRVETVLTLRRGDSVLVNLLIPLGALIFFGSSHSNLLAGVLTAALVASAMLSVGIGTGYERHYGVLKRLGGTPLGRPTLLAAKATSTLVVQVLQSSILLVVGIAILGMTAEIHLARLVAICLLGTFAFASIGLLMAGTLRAELNLAVLNALFLLLMVSGGLLVPEGPPNVAAAMSYLPARALNQSLDWALHGGAAPVQAMAVLSCWGFIAAGIASFKFSWE